MGKPRSNTNVNYRKTKDGGTIKTVVKKESVYIPKRPPPTPKPSGCFPKNTAILTPVGLQAISNLKEGDFVLSYDVSQQKLLTSQILKAIKYPANKIWEMRFDDVCIRTTASHSFLLDDATWKKASEIKSGDKVKFTDGFKRVTRSGQTTDIEEVYNLIVKENYNFIADGVIAHSFSYFRAVRMFFYSLIANFVLPKRTLNTNISHQPQEVN